MQNARRMLVEGPQDSRLGAREQSARSKRAHRGSSISLGVSFGPRLLTSSRSAAPREPASGSLASGRPQDIANHNPNSLWQPQRATLICGSQLDSGDGGGSSETAARMAADIYIYRSDRRRARSAGSKPGSQTKTRRADGSMERSPYKQRFSISLFGSSNFHYSSVEI